MLIAQRVDSLDCPPSLKRWIFVVHIETMRILQVCLTAPEGTPGYMGFVNLFGQAFVDRGRSPGVKDIQILCSAWYSGVAALSVLSGYPPELIRLLFIQGALVYGRTREYAENWSQFVEAERPSLQGGPHPFLENLGQRVFLEILLALGLLQPEYPKYVLNAWSQLGSKIACDVAALAREISDACAPGPSGESDRPLGGWVNVRYAAFRPVCRNLTSRLSRLTRLCPPAEQIFRRQRNEAYAYFHATGDVLRQLVQGEAARGEETSRIIGPLVRLDVNGYLRFIAALHAYHNVGTYGPGNGGIRGLLETVHDAYGLSDSFPTAWLEACSKGDVAKSLVERLRDDAVAEVLGLNEHGAFLNALLCTLGAMAAEAAHSLMNHPDWPAQGDCAMLGNLR